MIRPICWSCLSLIILLGLPPAAVGLCNVPQPRLVRAEYSQSDAVVIARLVKTRHIEPKRDPDYYLYTFEVEKTFRGSIPNKFVVWDENSSGRLTFDVLRGHEYLLFVNRWPEKEKDWWTADGCGNSGEVSKRPKTLKRIERLSTVRGGRIIGEVNSDNAANARVAVLNKNNGKQFKTQTDANGRFVVDVPAGEYSVQVIAAGKHFVTHWLSYEDAELVKLEDGGCAQIEFVPSDSSEAKSNLNR